MAEPSRVYPVKHLSNFVGTDPSFIHSKEELSQLKSILQEMPSGILCHALQVGYGRSYGGLIPLYLPCVQILPAMLLQTSVEKEPILSTSLQDWTELHYWVRLPNRRDQDGGPCRAHYDEAIKVSRLAGNMWSNAAFSPVLPCARS